MKKLLILIPLLAGCVHKSDIRESLEVAHQAAESLARIAIPAIDYQCRQQAVGCAELGDEECVPLQKCDRFRQRFGLTLIMIYQTLVAADVALAVEDFAGAAKALSQVTQLMSELRTDLTNAGILGG